MGYILGDRVVLKCGGPTMCVSKVDVDEDGTLLTCVWFDKSDNIQKERFRSELVLLK